MVGSPAKAGAAGTSRAATAAASGRKRMKRQRRGSAKAIDACGRNSYACAPPQPRLPRSRSYARTTCASAAIEIAPPPQTLAATWPRTKSRSARTPARSHSIRTEELDGFTGEPGFEPELMGPKSSVLPVTPLPKWATACRRRRYYDASGVRAHRRHPRRRRGNAHAFRAAEGPAPAVRAAADPVAGGRRAGGRRREGRRGRQPEAAARGPAARGRRASRSRSSRTGPATRSPPPARTSTPTRTVVVINGDVPLITAEAIDGARRRRTRTSGAAGTMATMELDDPRAYGRVIRDERRQRRAGRRGQGRRGRRDARAARDPRGQHRHLRVRRRRLLAALGRARHRQRPGRAATCPTCCRSCARPARRSPRT